MYVNAIKLYVQRYGILYKASVKKKEKSLYWGKDIIIKMLGLEKAHTP